MGLWGDLARGTVTATTILLLSACAQNQVTIGSAFEAVSLFVKDAGGNVTFATTFRPANPPSNDVRIGTFAQLASHTTYQVYVSVSGGTNFPNSGCTSTPAVIVPQNVLLGSFTTG
jgi:hypothetical protein